MFQLYKKRDVSSLISDTISLFKSEGKTFFKNYFIINGPLLALLVVCIYLLSDNLFSSVFQSNTNVETLLGNDFAYSGFLVVILVIVSIVFSVISYTFPILYLKNIEDNVPHTPSLYLSQIKSVCGRAILFTIGTSFLILPLLVICLFVSVLLVFVIIGIPILFILSAFSVSWISISYYEYIHNKTSFFNSYGKAFDIIKANFWTTIGNTIIVYLIIQIITSIISFIPQSYYYFKLFTSLNDGTSIEDELSPLFALVMGLTMIISLIVSFILNSIMLINQGLIYYSGKENETSFNAFNSIEEIGSNEI